MKRLFAVLVLVLAPLRSFCDVVVFEDSFAGSVFDTSKWDIKLPFSDSAVTQSGGKANLFARGTIVSKASFTDPYTLAGSFVNLNNTAHSAYSVFVISLRTSGAYTGDPYGGIDGLVVSMWARTAAPGGGDGLYFGISNGTNFLTRYWYPTTGQEHFFSLSDNGASVSLDIDGVRMFDYATSASWGNKIGFASRETLVFPGSDYTGDVDLLGVQVSVPEPSSLSLLLAGGAVLMAGRRRTK
jgi:hypothetical protein